MLTHQSRLFGKARPQPPADAEAISHKLLARAGYINQLAAGIFSILPLGWRVQAKIENIIREEMNATGAQEVRLPAMQPASLWAESGRLETMDPPLFRFEDRHHKELVLASTHEDVITKLAAQMIDSYQDLPLAVYQIQTKFRNETRATGGLLRVREFTMKDLYSFHRDTADLQQYYEVIKNAYGRIFQRCDLSARAISAASGSIGGSVSHEFSVEAPTGEDTVLVCSNCNFAANSEVGDLGESCPQCQGPLVKKSCIENGHIFQLGTIYSEKLNARFTQSNGQREPVVMGCYGIGVGRLLATIVETHHDAAGIMWPASVAPFDFHVVGIQPSVKEATESIAEQIGITHDILVDDRAMSAGQKFAEADLIGIPTRIIVSEKTEAAGQVEIVRRGQNEKVHVPKTDVSKWLADHGTD